MSHMGLKGSFKEFSLSDIVQLIYLQKKGGKLSISAGGRVWQLGFERGMLVSATCDAFAMPRMGEILVRQGYIDREILSAALRDQENRPRHLGVVLEEMDAVSHEDIARALNFQIQETALNLFFFPDGDYQFERVPVTYDTEYVTPINTEFILMEGARRVDEWPAISKAVGGGDAVFAPAPGVDEVRRQALSPAEQVVLQAVDGERSVSELVHVLSMGLFDSCRILADLLGQGLVVSTTAGGGVFEDPVSGSALGGSAGIGAGGRGSNAAFSAVTALTDPAHSKNWLWMGAGFLLTALSVAAWFGGVASHLP